MIERISIEKCPVCNGPAKELGVEVSYKLTCFADRVPISFSYCSSCGFVFQNNPLSRISLAQYYSASPRYRSPVSNPVELQLYKEQMEFMVKGGLTANCLLLDIGAEMGKLLDVLKEKYSLKTFYTEDCEAARLHLNSQGIHQEISDLTESNKFNWVVLSQVLEHIVDPIGFLRSLTANLLPSGKLFIEVPNHSFWNSLDYGFSFEHVNYFSSSTLVRVLYEAGFVSTVLEVGTNERYFGGNVRIIRIIAELAPQLTAGVQSTVVSHHQRGMTDRFERIRSLAEAYENQGKIALYGAGELTDLFLANTKIASSKLFGIFDTDTKKHRTTFQGLTIYPPEDISRLKPAAIVILSGADVVIKKTIDAIGFSGPVLSWGDLRDEKP